MVPYEWVQRNRQYHSNGIHPAVVPVRMGIRPRPRTRLGQSGEKAARGPFHASPSINITQRPMTIAPAFCRRSMAAAADPPVLMTSSTMRVRFPATRSTSIGSRYSLLFAPGLVTECTDTDNSSEYQNLRELPN